jgi:EmrB/QacA subfamily drug resistance transporter
MAIDHPHWLLWLPHPQLPADEKPYEKRWFALPAVSLAVFFIALDISIIGIIAPAIIKELGATSSQIQWSFDAYTVTLASFVVLGGALADRLGRKGMLQTGGALFAAGAAISGLAGNVAVLLAGRVISGFGAAFAFPSALSIISTLFPPNERHRAVSIFASISAAGLTAGPVVGAFLLRSFWFGAAFLFVVPFAVLAVVLVGMIVPPSRRPGTHPIDGIGALLSMLGLGGIVFAIIEGPGRGWASPAVLAPMALGVIASVAFVLWELRHENPLFDVRVFKDERVIAGALCMAVVYFTFESMGMLFPQYLRYVANESIIFTGLALAPLGLCLVLLSPQSGPLTQRFGQQVMAVFSLIMMGAGMLVLAALQLWGGLFNVIVGLVVYGVGFGLIVSAATSAVMIAIPKEKAGDGSAVNLVSRQLGGAIGVAVLGSLASAIYRSKVDLASFDVTAQQQHKISDSLAGVVAIQHELEPKVAEQIDAMADAAMVDGLVWAMVLGAILCAVSAALSAYLLRKREKPDAQPAT